MPENQEGDEERGWSCSLHRKFLPDIKRLQRTNFLIRLVAHLPAACKADCFGRALGRVSLGRSVARSTPAVRSGQGFCGGVERNVHASASWFSQTPLQLIEAVGVVVDAPKSVSVGHDLSRGPIAAVCVHAHMSSVSLRAPESTQVNPDRSIHAASQF